MALKVTYLRTANIQAVIERYESHFRAAVREFCQEIWPCSFIDRKGRHCVNVSTKHQKGHQIASGKVVAVGEYVDGDRIQEICEGSIRQVSSVYGELLGRLSQRGAGCERSSAAEIQGEILSRQPYSVMWSSGLSSSNTDDSTTTISFSHHTCFGCMFSVPALALPCGHILCDACIQDFSEPDIHRQWVRLVKYCPLCGNRNEVVFDPPWVYNIEPQQTAPRVLSLDG